ncbi:inositol polyphosphate multikinase [[Candida] jaroonii]|uniref:Inositol polyphosphate multikinase n=1 Tax=[Candida] jaroonii TaxID=467808 RepID=A0ACA9Y0L4_9ASCO|nr:inositol polyphosphate multikinase [[Candida] jaroonii]
MSFKPSQHQVAGHDGCLIAKGLFAKPSNDRESSFYSQLIEFDNKKAKSFTDQDDQSGYVGDYLSNWVPSYFGDLTENQLDEPLDLDFDQMNVASKFIPPKGLVSTDKKYILLSNLYEDFVSPSILDIKLGSVLTDDLATPEKVERLHKVSQSTTSGSLGFRICGMKLFQKDEKLPDLSKFKNDAIKIDETVQSDDGYLKFNKIFGRSLTPGTVPDALRLFISNSVDEKFQYHYLEQFYKRLQLLYNCLLDYEVRIISGSLLFIIENNPTILGRVEDPEEFDPLISDKFDINENDEEEDDDDDDDDNENPHKKTIKKLSSLNMIDFAHATFVPGQGPDDNVLQGVENLIKIFEDILEVQ